MGVNQDDRIQEYIDNVCTLVKLREAHPEIKLELSNHLQEIAEEYMSQGLCENDAVSKAISQMGSADIVGKQLDRVHKPKPEWGIIAISFIFVNLGLLAMYFIEKQALFQSASIPLFSKTLVYTIVGIAVVTGLYFLDYRKLESYSKHLYMGTLLLLVIVQIFGQPVNGKYYLSLGKISFYMAYISPLLLSVALAGILNKWNWQDTKKAFLGLLLCLMPLFLILASSSVSIAVIYSITCLTLIKISGAGKRHFFFFIGSMLSIIMLVIISAPYRLMRLFTFINPEKDPLGSGYLNIQLSKLIHDSGFFGQGFTLQPKILPELHTDFIFSYITFTFGWLAGAALIVLVVLFMIRLTQIATTVKSNYAKLLTSGIITLFAVQFLWNILMNLGMAPLGGVGLPFISFGGSQLLFNAIALGIISSIYKLRNISVNSINIDS